MYRRYRYLKEIIEIYLFTLHRYNIENRPKPDTYSSHAIIKQSRLFWLITNHSFVESIALTSLLTMFNHRHHKKWCRSAIWYSRFVRRDHTTPHKIPRKVTAGYLIWEEKSSKLDKIGAVCFPSFVVLSILDLIYSLHSNDPRFFLLQLSHHVLRFQKTLSTLKLTI